jgi:hypothetical protein
MSFAKTHANPDTPPVAGSLQATQLNRRLISVKRLDT